MAIRTYRYPLFMTPTLHDTLEDWVNKCIVLQEIYTHYNEKSFSVRKKTLSNDEVNRLFQKVKSKFLSLPSEIFLAATNHILKQHNSIKPSPLKNIPLLSTSYNDGVLTVSGFGNLKMIKTRTFPQRITHIFIKKQGDNWYAYVSFYIPLPPLKTKELKHVIGIDVGLKEFAFLSNQTVIENPRFYRMLEQKIRTEQSKLSKKQPDSNNWVKQKKKVNKLYQKIYHQRNNFLHQLSNQIVAKYDIIGIEKLPIKQMSENKQFSKSILDASWGIFVKMLKYKAAEKGKIIIEVDRYYPSSQICHACKSKQLMPLHLRTFQCKNCYKKIDRDYNASLNIAEKTKEIFIKEYLSGEINSK